MRSKQPRAINDPRTITCFSSITEVAVKDVNLTVDEVTFAQALAALKSVKAKVKANVVEEPSIPVSAASTKQEELTDEEKARLFVHFLEQRRNHFAAKRAKEKRNKPPNQAQQRKIICTYLKNMEGKKPKDLKNKSFDSIQKMFDKAFKRVNTFVDFRTDLVEAKIKELMEIVLDKEKVAIDDIPLAVKPPSIVDWKIHKEGKKTYYQIIRADGSLKMYLIFSHMLKNFDRENLETLWKLVKAKHGSIRPKEGYERVLWGDLKIYMLVEKKYYLTPATITDMLNKKFQCDHFSELTYQLLKLLIKQLKNP
ncbi:hypothetical protein Tco_1292543 [Tanacetum coccineum]